MKYYSEILGKLYDNKADLFNAEKAYTETREKEEAAAKKKAEEKKVAKDRVNESYNKYIEARNEYIKIKEEYDRKYESDYDIWSNIFRF